MDTVTSITIPTWGNGPDGSANGGLAAGLIASATGWSGPIDVSLRLPPPLATPITIEHDDEGRARACVGDQLIATAQPTQLDDLVIPPQALEISVADAQAGSRRFPYRDEHPFPRCLCCGIARANDVPSLEIHCGAVPGAEQIHAATWTPSPDVADPQDATLVATEVCWSALDCPSASPFADPDRPAVLARFEVELIRRARVGEPHVLAVWELGRDGRKLTSASALLTADGELIGRARALWIEVRRT